MATACGAGPGASTAPKTVGSPGLIWVKDDITTCWETVADETEQYRDNVREAVFKAFAGLTIRIRGFDPCPPSGGDIRIFVYDEVAPSTTRRSTELRAILREEAAPGAGLSKPDDDAALALGHPRVRRIGRGLQGLPAGLVLNRSFRHSLPGFSAMVERLSPQGRRNLALSVALHEFGHALGMRHEDAHSEATCTEFAEERGSGPGAAVDVTPYNFSSFMSRCYYRPYDYEKGYVLPNDADIEGINSLYASRRGEVDSSPQ